MALQLLNLGALPTPTSFGGEGGDKYRVAHTKINENFVYLDSKVVPVANELGQSTTYAVSQKLLTDVVGDIDSALTAINGVSA